MPDQLSVVIAAYNEEKVIASTCVRVCEYLERAGQDNELVIVDDGSRDRTVALVRKLQGKYPNLRLVQNDRNRGKGYAIRNGVLHSRGRYVLYTDADLVYPIEGVEPFVAAIDQGADVAIGSRSHPSTLFAMHPRHFSYIYQRYLVGRTYINIANRMLRLGVSDTQCGFKAFSGDAARAIFSRTRRSDFAFDVEVIHIANLLGLRIVELPVYFLYLGEQSSVQLLKDSVRMFNALREIRSNGLRGLYGPTPAEPRAPAVEDERPVTLD